MKCLTKIFPHLILVEIPVHKTYSAEFLGTFQPETRQEGTLYRLMAPSCNVKTRSVETGDACFEQYADSSTKHQFVTGKWKALTPSNPIGKGSRVIITRAWNETRVARKLFPELRWRLSDPIELAGRDLEALHSTPLLIKEWDTKGITFQQEETGAEVRLLPRDVTMHLA